MTKLEWSEEQQVFHYNSAGSRAKENSNGFVTIGEYTDDNEASFFADFLQVQFLESGKSMKANVAKRTLRNLERFIIAYEPILRERYDLDAAEALEY